MNPPSYSQHSLRNMDSTSQTRRNSPADSDELEYTMDDCGENSQPATSNNPNNTEHTSDLGGIDPAIYAETDALLALDSPTHPAHIDPDKHSFLGDWQGQEVVYLAWRANAENDQQHDAISKGISEFDHFSCADDDLATFLETAPSQSADLSPNLEPCMTHEEECEIWIHLAVSSPVYLQHDLLRCSQDLQPKSIFELSDLPVLCAQFARALILQQVRCRWILLPLETWLKEMRILRMAREDGLWPWAPLDAWFSSVDSVELDNLQGEERARAKRDALDKLNIIERQTKKYAREEIWKLLSSLKWTQVCSAIVNIVQADVRKTSSLMNNL